MRLPLEATPKADVLRQALVEHLDGHRASEDEVIPPPDSRHSTPAQPPDKLVSAAYDQRWHRRSPPVVNGHRPLAPQ